jgi:anti-sigma B factor antagonist
MILEMQETEKLLVAKITQQEANLNNAEQFKQEMFAIIDNGNHIVALSFEQVTYVDSSFLGAMVSSLKYALAKGTEIYLTDLNQDILDLLHLIRMDKVFKIRNDVAEVVSNI